jgi:hypothetical protein
MTMSATAGTLTSVTYIDPWGITPPGSFQTGVVIITGGTPPSGTVLAACLVQGTTPIAYGTGATNNLARILPPAPLSPGLSYQVWIQWIAAGQKAEQATWPTSTMLTAAVIVAVPHIISGAVSGSTATVNWDFGIGAGGNSGAVVRFYDTATGFSIGYIFQQGNSGSSAVPFDSTKSYVAYIQPVQPADAQTQGGFSAPFSFGPYAAPIPVTAAAPSISSVAFDGTTLAVGWAPVAVPASPVPTEVAYSLSLLDGQNVIASFPAAPNGGVALVDLPLRGRTITVAGLVRFGPIRGPLGGAQSIITSAPSISKATLAASGGSLTVTAAVVAPPSGLPVGATITVELLQDGITLSSKTASGTPLSAALTFTSAAGHRYALRAYAATTTPVLSGPSCAPLPLLTTAPSLLRATYDGAWLTLGWTDAGAGVTGHTVVLTPSTGNAISLTTGAATELAVQLDLDLNATWQVTVQPFGPNSLGLASSSAAVPMPTLAAPVISSASYDGRLLTLYWSRATLPYLTGYTVKLTGSSLLSLKTGPETSLALALAPTAATGTNVIVSGNSPSRSTAASAAVSIVAAVPTITAVTVSSQIAITWTLIMPNGASVVGELLDGDTVVATATGTSTGATLSLPSTSSGSYAVRGHVELATARGPDSALVAVLPALPVLSAATYDGERLALAWQAGATAGLLGYTVTLKPATGNSITLTTGPAPMLEATLSLDLGTTWQATVQAFGANTTGRASAAMAVALPSLAAPVLRTLAYDGATLRINWAPAALPYLTGYTITLTGGVTQSVKTGSETSLALPLVPSALSTPTITATITANAPTRNSATSTATTALVAIPTITKAVTDPLSGTTTVSWAALASPVSGYLVQLFVGGVPTGAPLPANAASLPLPGGLTPAADMAIAVAATATVSSVALTGPYSPRFALPTRQPTITNVDYDGVSALVEWTAAAGATGYRASVVAGGLNTPLAQITAPANATQARFTVPSPDTSKTYSIVIQAMVGESSGPLSAPVPLFMPGLYLSTSNNLPRLFPATMLTITPAATTIYLPNIGSLTQLPIPQSENPATEPFIIDANSDSKTKAAFPYTVKIASTALTFGSDSIRSSLKDSYTSLLLAAERQGATPQGIYVLQQVVARLMPQTFAETLFYAYGLLPTSQHADLRPGMILRVGFGAFNLLPGNKPPVWAIGYSGGGAVDYEIGDYFDDTNNAWLVGFDAFLGWLVSSGILSVPAPTSDTSPGPAFSESGAADAADLFFPAFRRPFYRLFFPSSLQSATLPAQSLTMQQFTIAAASTYTILNNATAWPSSGVSVAYFRGRAVVKLCIRVVLNGVEEVVPIGSTVGNLLDRFARRPPSTSIALRGLSLERALGPAILDPTAPYNAGAAYRVRFDWNQLATFGTGRDVLALPLLHGDRLTIDRNGRGQ